MKTMRLREFNKYQDPAELRGFIEFVVSLDVRRYLEIGSRFGDSFYAVMANLRSGAFGMSIDLPESPEKMARLAATGAEITSLGSQVVILYGSSRDVGSKAAAQKEAPFDLVLIDADHTYEGVKADWEDYSGLGKVVVLHDVIAPDDWRSDGKPNGVGKFWREVETVQSMMGAQTRVIATPGSKMGYGIVVKSGV